MSRLMEMHCVSNARSTHAPIHLEWNPLAGLGIERVGEGAAKGRRSHGTVRYGTYSTGIWDSFGGEHKEEGRNPGEVHNVTWEYVGLAVRIVYPRDC